MLDICSITFLLLRKIRYPFIKSFFAVDVKANCSSVNFMLSTEFDRRANFRYRIKLGVNLHLKENVYSKKLSNSRFESWLP